MNGPADLPEHAHACVLAQLLHDALCDRAASCGDPVALTLIDLLHRFAESYSSRPSASMRHRPTLYSCLPPAHHPVYRRIHNGSLKQSRALTWSDARELLSFKDRQGINGEVAALVMQRLADADLGQVVITHNLKPAYLATQPFVELHA